MNITQLIKELEALRVKHGEMQVADFNCHGEYYFPAKKAYVVGSEDDEDLPSRFVIITG